MNIRSRCWVTFLGIVCTIPVLAFFTLFGLGLGVKCVVDWFYMAWTEP